MELLSLPFFSQEIITFVVSVYLCWFLYKQIEFHVWGIPPGPIGIPIFGYAPFLSKDKLHEDLAQLNKKYGKLCSITAGLKRLIVVGDYDTAKDLLSHPAALGRPPQFFNIAPEEGGFVGMSGPLWEQERKFIMQAVKNMGLGRDVWNEIIQDAVVEFVSYIASKKGQPINVSGQLAQYAVTNMAALLFGRQFIDKRPNPEIEILDKTYKIFKKHFSFSNPAVLWPWLLKYFVKFNINGYRQKSKLVELSGEIIRKEIAKRLSSDDEYDPSTDFIKSYLHHSLKENSSADEVNSSVNYLIGHVALFFSTSDSATTPVEWLLLLMAANPEVQAKVHAEIDDVAGRSSHISWSEWRKFPYSVACVKEMLRWINPSPIFPPRRATKNFKFQGYTITKDCAIVTHSWAMHQDPKYWNNPTEYVPERYLCSEEKELIKVEGYGIFSFGKRNCPGENIALMVLFQFFTGIMQKFTINTATGDPPDLTPHFEFTTKPTSQDLCFIER